MWTVPGAGPGTYPIPSAQQWSLNPAAYKNIPYDQVDWATLAQQWIRMKETVPPIPPPVTQPMMEAPPAPRINTTFNNILPPKITSLKGKDSKDGEEGGEAPMEMDTKDDEILNAPNVPQVAGNTWNQWNNWHPQWGWGWPPNTGTAPVVPGCSAPVDIKVKTHNSDPFPVFNDYVPSIPNFPVDNATCTPKIPLTPGAVGFANDGGSNFPPPRPQEFRIIPPCVSNPSELSSWSKNSSKVSIEKNDMSPVQTSNTLPLDAVKRKQLPAWIREGLSKMEKEKQRRLKQEVVKIEPHDTDSVYGMRSDSVLSNISSHDQQVNNDDRKAAFTTHSEKITNNPIASKRKSRFGDVINAGQNELSLISTESTVSNKVEYSEQPSASSISLSSSPPRIRKTKDQLLTETMLKVRRILTEILLDVTDQQVQALVKEEYSRAKSSSIILPQRKSGGQSLPLLGSRLGLTQYDSYSSNSEDEADDSDEDLKVLIETKKSAFKQTEEEIEKEIEMQEERERLVIDKDNENRRKYEGNTDDDEDDDDDDVADVNERGDIDTDEKKKTSENIVEQETKPEITRWSSSHLKPSTDVGTEKNIQKTMEADQIECNATKSERRFYGDSNNKNNNNYNNNNNNNNNKSINNTGNLKKVNASINDNDNASNSVNKSKQFDEIPNAPPAPIISHIVKKSKTNTVTAGASTSAAAIRNNSSTEKKVESTKSITTSVDKKEKTNPSIINESKSKNSNKITSAAITKVKVDSSTSSDDTSEEDDDGAEDSSSSSSSSVLSSSTDVDSSSSSSSSSSVTYSNSSSASSLFSPRRAAKSKRSREKQKSKSSKRIKLPSSSPFSSSSNSSVDDNRNSLQSNVSKQNKTDRDRSRTSVRKSSRSSVSSRDNRQKSDREMRLSSYDNDNVKIVRRDELRDKIRRGQRTDRSRSKRKDTNRSRHKDRSRSRRKYRSENRRKDTNRSRRKDRSESRRKDRSRSRRKDRSGSRRRSKSRHSYRTSYDRQRVSSKTSDSRRKNRKH